MLGNPEVATQAEVGLPRLPPGVRPQVGGEAGVRQGLMGDVCRAMLVRLCILVSFLGLLMGERPPTPSPVF
jgi:hypothetical protein